MNQIDKRQRAPTLYGIIILKLGKGFFFLGVALVLYALSDNNLPFEYNRLLHWLHVNPETAFFNNLAGKVKTITEANVLWVSLGTASYATLAMTEGIGLIFRGEWASWLAIAESAFFIPIELLDLRHHFSWTVTVILVLNIIIFWYLLLNRKRLFEHHFTPSV